MTDSQRMTVSELVDRAGRLAGAARAQGRRRILGIVGAPGAGKSTLAQLLVAALAPGAAQVEMDGFHLAGAVLRDLGRQERKGAIDTFDAHGYAALLGRLRAARAGDDPVYAPLFDRDLEEPIAGGVAVPGDVPLVVTAGNYLLADGPPWRAARACLDEVWFLTLPEELRLARLVARHERHGTRGTAGAPRRRERGRRVPTRSMPISSRPRRVRRTSSSRWCEVSRTAAGCEH